VVITKIKTENVLCDMCCFIYYYITLMSNAKYDNCTILDMRDKVIGKCPRRRLDWYLRKDIAERVDDSTIRLKFEPNYKDPDSLNFDEIVTRESVCVVCGESDKLNKFHIIPKCFKTLFPVKLRSRSSADVILLCDYHSNEANYYSDQYKQELYEKYEVYPSNFVDEKKQDIKTIAQKIIKKQTSINKSKHGDKTVAITKDMEKLDELIKSCGLIDNDVNTVDVNTVDVNTLANLNTKIMVDDIDNAYEYIVKKSLENDNNKIREFIKDWKDFFVETSNPEYLPNDFYNCN
jgi:hypothetical protein